MRGHTCACRSPCVQPLIKIKVGMVKILRTVAIVILISVVSVPLAGLAVFYMVPLNAIEGRVVAVFFQDIGIAASLTGFERVFPFGLRAKDIALKDASSGRPLLYIDGAWVGFNPLSIFSGGIGADFKASLIGGLVSGSVITRLSGRSVDMKMESVSLLSIPAFERLKITAEVPFDGDLSITLPENGCASGEVRLIGKTVSGAEVRLGGFPLPVGDIDSAGLEAVSLGLQTADDCLLELKGLWIKGSEIEAMMRGTLIVKDSIEASLVDLILEVRPKGLLLKKEYMLSYLKDYRTGKGFYRVPVKGRLGEVLP